MVLHSLSCLGFFWSFFGGDAKSLAWVFLPRRLLPFVFGFFFLPFLGAMPNPSLGCSCSSGAAFRVCVVFFCFLGGDAKSLAWVLLALWVPNHPVFLGSNHPLTCVQHLLSFTIWIDVIHPDGHGLAKRLSGATEWESLLNGFSILSHFIVTVLWTLLRNLYKMVPVILKHFLDISTKWFYPKNNIWHHMINISFLPLY